MTIEIVLRLKGELARKNNANLRLSAEVSCFEVILVRLEVEV